MIKTVLEAHELWCGLGKPDAQGLRDAWDELVEVILDETKPDADREGKAMGDLHDLALLMNYLDVPGEIPGRLANWEMHWLDIVCTM
jgi:hypothetical protein